MIGEINVVELVEIKKEDIDQCIEIYFSAFDNNINSDGSKNSIYEFTYDRRPLLKHYFIGCIDQEGKYALCLKDDSKIVGIITAWNILCPETEDAIHIDSIAVAPECQKKGYGTIMINEFIRTISKDKMVVLNTKKTLPAYGLYKKLGFIESDVVTMQKSPVIEKLKDEIEEQKALLKKLMAEKEELLQNLKNEQFSEK